MHIQSLEKVKVGMASVLLSGVTELLSSVTEPQVRFVLLLCLLSHPPPASSLPGRAISIKVVEHFRMFLGGPRLRYTFSLSFFILISIPTVGFELMNLRSRVLCCTEPARRPDILSFNSYTLFHSVDD